MALFKISKGLSKNLMTNVPYAKEGFAYFTSDDGKFYIDIDGDGSNNTPAVIGNNRIPLNAYTSDILKATSMGTNDNVVYPLLTFKVKDSTKNLIEAKYGAIGIKNGTLVIPNVNNNDEILISNTGAGRGIVIDNTNGTGHAIEITAGKGIKVAKDPVDNLELATKQYVDNQNVVLELNMATGAGYWIDQTSYDFTLSAKAQVAYSRLNEAINKGYTPTVIINDIDSIYIYKYSFTQNLIFTALLVFTVEVPLSNDANHMGKDFIAFQSNMSGTTLTVQRLNKPLEYIPGDGKVNQILSVSNNGQATWLDIPSIGDLGGATKDHTHDDRYYTETEIDDKLKALLGANDAMIFKGIVNKNTDLPDTHETGWTYRVNKAGTYAGKACEIGDLVICITDGLSANDAHWTVAQTNIDGAVIGPVSSTNDNIVIFNGNTGKLIKDSGKKLSDLSTIDHNHDSNYVKKTGDTMTGNLVVGSSSIGTNGYITGTWLQTTAVGNKAGNFATIDGSGWIYKRTPTQVLSDIGAAPNSHNHDSTYLPLSGGTLTGNLTAPTFHGELDGNADTATKFKDAQSITLIGDVTGTASSQAGWSITTTLSNSGVTNGTYGPTEDVNGSNGATISVPQITVDAKGRVTSIVNRTYTSVNTDTNTTYSAGTGLSLSGTTINHSNTITAGSVGSAQSPSHGDTFAIPKITYDAQGHITEATTVNITLPADNNTDTNVTTAAQTSSKIYVTGTPSTGTVTGTLQYNANVYISDNVMYGACWNDYAEYRISDCQEPGRVICENGDDTLSLATERLQPAGNVISDTFGFAIGETKMAKTPIAISGRVLVYPYEDRYSYNPGDAVCAAPGGTVSKMTREEIITYPERIIGTVSAIPEYETWGEGNISVNGRIWIKVS